MGWIYRKADQHECAKPSLDGAHANDVWECSECGAQYIVRDDQRDGLYFVKNKPLPKPREY